MTNVARIAAMVLDLLVFLAVSSCVVRILYTARQGKELRKRLNTFRYFTTDSNIFCAVSCLVSALGLISLPEGAWLSHGLLVFRYIGTVAVTVTFLTVMFFLGPTIGYKPMLSDTSLWLHLICPVLAIVSLLLEKGSALFPADMLWGLVPVVLYGLLYLYMVVLRKGEKWEDFYGFNRNGKWPVSMALMFAGAGVICAVLYLI